MVFFNLTISYCKLWEIHFYFYFYFFFHWGKNRLPCSTASNSKHKTNCGWQKPCCCKLTCIQCSLFFFFPLAYFLHVFRGIRVSVTICLYAGICVIWLVFTKWQMNILCQNINNNRYGRLSPFFLNVWMLIYFATLTMRNYMVSCPLLFAFSIIIFFLLSVNRPVTHFWIHQFH